MEETKQELPLARLGIPILCILITLGGLVFFYGGLLDFREGLAQSDDYHRAPGCTPTGVVSSGLLPCQMQTMTIAAKDQTDGGDEMPDTYKLDLQAKGGAEQTVELVGRSGADLFAHVAVGQSVQTKIWQGKILVISIPGWHCGTPGHPDVQVFSGRLSMTGGGVLALVGGLGTLFGWRANKKKPLRQGDEAPQGSEG